MLAETDASGNTLDEYVYFDGSRIARRDASGNVYYYFPDTLGSEVSITNATGTACFDADFYLFGGEKVFTNNCPPSHMFAGMERDSETGLDHTLNRQYSSQYGRWLSPDPMGGDIMNPQSLNRYAYALNNPTTFTDPLGLSGGNPADPCSDPSYYDSHAECGGPPPCTTGVYDPACAGYPGCVAYGTEGCIPYPPSYPSGGYGGGGPWYGGGGGGAPPPPGAPPAGQPPLAGMGNASFPNGSNVCSIVFIPGVGPELTCTRTPFPDPGIIAGIGGAISGGVIAALNYLKSHPVTASVTFGVAVQVTYQYSTNTLCGSLGLGASVPPTKMLTFGVLNGGNMRNWTNVVGGWSYTFGAGVVPGYQGSFSSSGKVGGPTISLPGASGSYTYGVCGSAP